MANGIYNVYGMQTSFNRILNCFEFSLWNGKNLGNVEFIKSLRNELVDCLKRFLPNDVYELFEDDVSFAYTAGVHIETRRSLEDILNIKGLCDDFYEGCVDSHDYAMSFFESEMRFSDLYEDSFRPFDYQDYRIERVKVFMRVNKKLIERDDYCDLIREVIAGYNWFGVDFG